MSDSEFYRTLLRAYIDSANDGIFVLCDEMKFHVANPLLQSWLDQSEDRLTEHGQRRPITDFIGGAENKALFSRQFAAVLQGQSARFECFIQPGNVEPRWLEIGLSKVDLDGGNLFIGVARDITDRKAAESRIENLAFFDSLTGLPNRRLLLDRLQHALASSSRSAVEGALLFMDLDNFKTLNDTLGHAKGDLLLQQVAKRVASCLREGDTVARFGGDEFVVMLENLGANSNDAANQAEVVGEKILLVMEEPFDLNGQQHRIGASIGVTLFAGHRNTVEDLLKRADLAMYQAKAAGRNALRFFEPEMQRVVAARAALEDEMRNGLKHGEFRVFYQAQVESAQGVVGVEALVRWQHPRRGLVAPIEFIPLAEETGLILPLGNWVLHTACAQLATWQDNAALAHLTVAVNVSAHQFKQKDYVAEVLAVLKRTGADPCKLKLELTESLLLHDVEDVIAKMVELRSHGVGFALDDFGTGYSSLAYLKRLPLDRLKIDRSFVSEVLNDNNDAVIVRTIVALAGNLGLSVIAEGVETGGQAEFLAANGCHACQGYLFGRPVPLAELEVALLQAPFRTEENPGSE